MQVPLSNGFKDLFRKAQSRSDKLAAGRTGKGRLGQPGVGHSKASKTMQHDRDCRHAAVGCLIARKLARRARIAARKYGTPESGSSTS